ncbi:Thiamine repressible genes regulatory protein thi1 [Talaromyces islandicus]|uniref:Thiamine repressible genes regulatory protein thi1 n=1 Tax=Talaromyces islandicus TaxID=28573 RepID=A0A0U1M9Y4_TALIS|nr:Thiamine repressible genes regulatory protein thi1 [Talaromyces islandicus]
MASSTPDRLHTDRPCIPTLTCESCRQRKIKCDKLNPCTNCQRAGINCESNKIDRLEALVNAALAGSSDTPNSTNTRNLHDKSPKGVSNRGSTTTDSSSPAPQLFTNLIKQVHGPQDFSSEHAEGEDKGNEDTSLAGNEPRSAFTGFSLGQLGGAQFHSLSLRPTPAVIVALCNVYLDHVDRIIKVLHRPSLKGHLVYGNSYSDGRSSIVAENALDAAVFYAAVTSMTDRQCQSLFHCSRATVLPEYQKSCEMSLERADLTRTRDVTVLQAFVLYLAATRAHDKSRAVWTLVATAVRLAQALNLHVECLGPSETFFSRQMRKRLWFTIGVLDLQTCFEPDSKPLIPLEMIQLSKPLNLNDSDFDQSHQGTEPRELDEVTDMTFALMTYKVQILARSMYRIKEDKELESTGEVLVTAFENDVYQLTKSCNPNDNSYSWFIYHSARSLTASAQLFTIGSITETPSSTQASCSTLEMCAKSIENVSRIHNDERGEAFRWYVTPQWPVVALAVRECYVSTDFATIRRVWPLIEEVFERYRDANSSVGGRPRSENLKKLMDTTRERVNMVLSDNSASASISEDPTSPQGEAFYESQPMSMDNPSWAAWESFMAELSLGQWTHDNTNESDANLFINPDLIFPFS